MWLIILSIESVVVRSSGRNDTSGFSSICQVLRSTANLPTWGSPVELSLDLDHGTACSVAFPHLQLLRKSLKEDQGQDTCKTVGAAPQHCSDENIPRNITTCAKAISATDWILWFGANEIHFWHDVDPRNFKIDHGWHCGENPTSCMLSGVSNWWQVSITPEVLVLVLHKLRFKQINSRNSYSELLKMGY